MLDDAHIVPDDTLHLRLAVLQQTFLGRLDYFGQQLVQKSAEMNLTHQYLADQLFLTTVLDLINQMNFGDDFSLRVLFRALRRLTFELRSTVLGSHGRLQLHTTVDVLAFVVFKTVKFVLGIIPQRSSVLARFISMQSHVG
jgi:hypothetical protein